MPWSSDEGKDVIRKWLNEFRPIRSVLDVGTGAGHYGRMVRHYVDRDAQIHGVEVWEPYIERFGLDRVYDYIYTCDVRDMARPQQYDLIILGDVLEHMPKDDAVAVVDFLKQSGKNLVVSLPIIEWHQDEVEGNPYEAHLHHWSVDEFEEAFQPVRSWSGESIGVFLVR